MAYYKVWLLLISFMSLWSVSGAAWLKFTPDIGTVALGDISHIHFNAGGNNFGGLLVWRSVDTNEDITIQASGSSSLSNTVTCKSKVRGYYYNSQRGERLWPLTESLAQGLGYADLVLTGGLYAGCGTGNYGIYGRLQHTFNGRDYQLIAGVEYDTSPAKNAIKSGSKLTGTLQLLDNKYPIGLLYDYNGGIGVVGCQLTGNNENALSTLINRLNTSGVNHSFILSGTLPVPIDASLKTTLDCSNVVMSLDQRLLLKIQGLIGVSTETNVVSEVGNEIDSKTQFFSSVNVNNATLVNYAKRRAEELCRGKWSPQWSVSPDVICREGKGGTQTVDVGDIQIQNKIIIVNDGSIALQGKMESATPPLNIFIDKGRLLLTQGPGDRIGFDGKGYPTSIASGVLSQGIYLKGNFIVNGLIGPSNYQQKVFIHGKFTSLNTYANPGSTKVQQLQQLLSSTIGAEDIDLTKVFAWRCGVTTGSDGSVCITNPLSEFRYAPLVIINQDYPSALVE